MTDVLIPWNPKKISNPGWNELCANVVEKFGLPGDKYVTEVCADWMRFSFKNEQDGFMCKILLSEYL